MIDSKSMNRITTAAARRKFGSLYHVAQILGLNRSGVGRWGRWVPSQYAERLITTPGKHLPRGGKRPGAGSVPGPA